MDTLVAGSQIITLPKYLQWTNEFSWTPVQASKQYSLHGTLIVDRGIRAVGRPIELTGGSDFGWVTRAVAQSLYSLSQQADLTMTLNYRGVAYSVAFDHENGPVLFEQVADFYDPLNTDFYVPTLRFFTVS